MFSKACEYAIRALIYLDMNSKSGKKTGIKEVSRAAGVPLPFTAKILQQLARKKLITSYKGPHGGFFVGMDSQPIYLLDIVMAIDGDKLFKSCALGLKECSETQPCALHFQIKKIRLQSEEIMKKTSLNDLSKDFVKGKFLLQ